MDERPAHTPAPQSSPITDRASEPLRVTLFGNFGTGNLGNECTLQAIVQNTRRFLPTAKINCVCSGPEEVARAHGIPAIPMSYRFARATAPPPARRREHPAQRLVRWIVIRVPREVVEWARAFRALRETSLLVMTGTGMLGDFGIGPRDLHYEILKWSILAKLRRCKLLFVSVGAGPIRDPLSRRIVKAALSLADHRSYRDEFSYRYLQSIGFDTSHDSVRPDLAFSLEAAKLGLPVAGRSHEAARRVVGLGLMDYVGNHQTAEEGERIYRRYLDGVSRFAAWLLGEGYSIRLLVGDLSFDTRVRRDLLRSLEERGSRHDPARIIEEPLDGLEDLYSQLARTDIVVATRFHNVLLALMLGKPVIALSYHEKLRSLMAGVGADAYTVDAEDLDVPRLIERFVSLENDAEGFSARMRAKAEEYRRALDEQYAHMFEGLRVAAPRPGIPDIHERVAAGRSAVGRIGGPLA